MEVEHETEPTSRDGRLHVAPVLVLFAGLALVIILLSGDSLLASFSDAMASVVTIVVLALIVMLSFVGFRIWSFGSRAAVDIEGAAAQFRSLAEDEDRRHGVPRSTMALMRTAMQELGGTGDIFGAQWREFEESLVRRDGRYFNTVEAGRFFTDEGFEASARVPVLGPAFSANYPFIHELPGFMTSLGMLGTFVGIAVGLGQLSGVSGDGAAGVVGQIGGVITGLASAFWTSIFGLAGAAVATWLNHRTDARLGGAMATLRLEIDRCLPRTVAERFLEEQTTEAKIQTVSLKAHTEALNTIATRQAESVDALNSMADDIAEGLGQQIGDHLGPILQEVAEIVRSQVSGADERSAEMANQLTESLVGSLNESVEMIGAQAEKISGSFTSLSEGLGAGMAQVVSQVDAGFSAASTRMNEAFDHTIGKVSAQMDAIGESMVSTMKEASQSAAKYIAEMVRPISAAAGQLEAVTQTLSALTKSQVVLLKEFNKSAESVANVSGIVVPLVDKITRQASAQQAMTDTLSQVGSEIQASRIRMNAIERTLNDGLAGTAATLSAAASHLHDLQSGMGQWNTSTGKSLETFATQMSSAVNKTLTEYDRSLTHGLNGLATLVRELESMAEGIQSAAAGAQRAR